MNKLLCWLGIHSWRKYYIMQRGRYGRRCKDCNRKQYYYLGIYWKNVDD